MSETTNPQGKEYLAGWTPWRIKRYWFYGLVTVLSLVIPWIQIDGNHLFLLSFDKLKLHLMFVQFDMQELYLMPFLLMILFIGIFGITVLGGRVFCGWMCPQTIFRVVYRDLIETKLLGLRKRIKNKQQEPDYSKVENKIKRVVALLLWTGLAFVAAADLMWYFVPPEDFFAYIQNPAEHPVLIGSILVIVGFLVYDVIFLKENFCVYVCPYSRIQSVLYDEDTVMAIYNPNRGGDIYNESKEKVFTKQNDLLSVNPNAECTTCESCVTVCPTHIDIRKGLQLECINCLECVDACTEVMGKLGKPTLVEWSSEKETLFRKGKTDYFRPKILGYIAVLVIVSIVLAMMGSKKEYMLLNINKENRLYSINQTEDGKVRVDNAYTFLLQNTLNEDHEYYFDVIAPAGMEGKIKIDQPAKPFKVKPGVVKKKVVVLYTEETLVNDDRKDTVIPITIRAYAIDAKDKVIVDRQSTFTFPRADLLK
ncbi:cytochrome c oxidase accessory protein CcoG [Sulfuricurvum sp. IAE1]|jgi:cytochrome c oxidase accessory protein FixG|uniref:cytochrome c oxidase accessory protein CcoG n=1 Tax=Sulfuricurvum sp. IAE1 TaxID=2546102 RepID=UPI00104DE61A|nr:cytochrome c oxidase accessory protein CcoG [Sulfuricurvum sp. IAE1]MDD3770199.1 cytochrome c oxidase accessory protein CcoG [Sulfuricurvum sp.]MDX9965578.1 cytochrome c oxidase accessory protein CcoG [Sulfuricurvum sp.]TDA68500.1 cytochrome c oxidase accessory protein CcoG [Sulfuricurvum sp. IAE1]